jgi:hypothetical protein
MGTRLSDAGLTPAAGHDAARTPVRQRLAWLVRRLSRKTAES